MCFEQQIGEFKMHIWETCVETKVGTHSIVDLMRWFWTLMRYSCTHGKHVQELIMCFEQQIGEFKMHIWETCVETKVSTHIIVDLMR